MELVNNTETRSKL